MITSATYCTACFNKLFSSNKVSPLAHYNTQLGWPGPYKHTAHGFTYWTTLLGDLRWHQWRPVRRRVISKVSTRPFCVLLSQTWPDQTRRTHLLYELFCSTHNIHISTWLNCFFAVRGLPDQICKTDDLRLVTTSKGEEPGGIFAEHTTQCRKEEACSWIRFSTRVVRRSLKRSISYTQATQWLQRNKSRVANLFKFCFKHTNLLPIRLPFSATTLEGAGHKFPCFNLLCSACFIRNIFIIFYFFDFSCKFCKHLVRHIDSGENITENCSHDSNILCTKVFPA